MGNRLSKIYTRTGDGGVTGLGDGSRTPKDSQRIEAIGSLDELNSAIGIVTSHPIKDEVHGVLLEIQHDLFDLGGELAMPGYTLFPEGSTPRLEGLIDGFNAELPPLKEFILPGGSPAVAACHMARTLCRRAERRVLTLSRNEQINADSVRYLNRLSDLLFVLCRVLARGEGGKEIYWDRNRQNKTVPVG